MRWQQAVARIFLFLSIINFAFAGVAQKTPTMHKMLGRPSTAKHLHSRVDPEDTKFFNKKLNRKMKEYFLLGAISGVFSGITTGAEMEITGSVSPGA